ncbi:MAG: hypothetical protein UX97_C0009G0023 [Candidatus Beckwithbacteria bacterium GW2011_GWA2_47_25]|nr:MAG: hypothetical protein UX97_C0009G0023 [Candidatus Beckwithbacteria bacterium GW2011_GWA2_47_25]
MNEPTHPVELSRRDVLKAMLVGVPAGLAIGTGLGSLVTKIAEFTPKEGAGINLNEILTAEQAKLLNEIREYRKSLALQELPAHLTDSKIKEASNVYWKYDINETVVEISDAHKSHAQQALRIQELLFGVNGKRLVSKIKSDTGMTSAGTYNNEGRTMTLDTIDDPTSQWFIFVSTHENMHATDPSLMTSSIYPLDNLIKISHGMARVLNQSTKIESMFMNNPGSYNIPFIKKGIGEGVGRLFLQDSALIDQVDFAGHEVIVSTLAIIAKKQETSIGNVRFTKKACLELGEALLPKILSKSISISGSLLNDWYATRVEAASKEIFADMVATALVTPDKIQDNQEILTGIAEVLSGVQGKQINISDIIKELHVTDNEIKERFVEEQEAVTSTEQQSTQQESQQTLDDTEVKTIQEEAEKEKQTQNTFWDFIANGTLPQDIGEDSIDIPVAEAWNIDVTYNLISDPSLIPENLEDLKRRISVLENFISSSAFKRPEEQSATPHQMKTLSHADALRARVKIILS